MAYSHLRYTHAVGHSARSYFQLISPGNLCTVITMNTAVLRRKVLTVLGTVGGVALVGRRTSAESSRQLGGVEAEDDPCGDSTEASYWTVTRDVATTTVTSDTDADVTSDGDLYVTSGVTIEGDVFAERHVILEDGTEVEGDIVAGGAVVTGSDVEVDGDVLADGDVLLGVDLDGSRAAFEQGTQMDVANVVRGAGVEVEGDVTTRGTVLLSSESVVEGDLTTDGTVILAENASVEGDVSAETVDQEPSTTADGDS